MKLTVYYDDQFWVGVVEEQLDNELKAARYIFGPEPHDSEILWFVNHKMTELLANTRSLKCSEKPGAGKRINPKRLARQVAKEIQHKGITTASQEAIQADLESRKKEKQTLSKWQREEISRRKREIAVRKAKEKHKGR